jgi:hypothetical protein
VGSPLRSLALRRPWCAPLPLNRRTKGLATDCLSWSADAARTCVCVFRAGYVFYLFSQVSHVQDSCQTHAATSDHAVASQCHAASQHASVELPASQHTDVEHAPLASTVADATADESAVLMLAEDISSHASVASPPKFAEAQDDSSRAGVSGGASRRSIADADVEAEGAGKKGDAHKGEWAAHQIEHTLDYAVDSPLWLHLSNGLNLQVVHQYGCTDRLHAMPKPSLRPFCDTVRFGSCSRLGVPASSRRLVGGTTPLSNRSCAPCATSTGSATRLPRPFGPRYAPTLLTLLASTLVSTHPSGSAPRATMRHVACYSSCTSSTSKYRVHDCHNFF